MDRKVPLPGTEKQMRIGTTKVRTGCITCKTRRVKCDEEKPACRRCTRLGRKCDGYQRPLVTSADNAVSKDVRMMKCDQPSHKPTTNAGKMVQGVTMNGEQERTWQSLIPIYSYLQLQRNEKESRSMDHFISQTGPQLAGFFDSSFWCDMVLRISQYNSAVWYCAVAVSSMHEHFERRMATINHENATHPSFALQNYNKAIASLRKTLACGEASMEVTLICCILFVCLEFLQGETKPAFAHIENGHKIFADWRLQHRSKSANRVFLRNYCTPGLEKTLMPMLSHLDVIGVLFGQTPSGIDWSHDFESMDGDATHDMPETFVTIEDARLSILNILNLSLRLEISIIIANGYVGIPNIGEHFKLETRLVEWCQAFAELKKLNPNPLDQQKRAMLIIMIHYHITRVLVTTNLASDEMVFDRCLADFEAIVSLAEMALKMDPGRGLRGAMQQQPSFTFEMGTISPLYYTALKCRHPTLRRKALTLLNAGPRRESIWDADVVSQVCRRVIELEEVGWTQQNDMLGTLDADRRIDRVIIMAAPNFNNGSHIVCSFAKLDRSINVWKAWEETFSNVWDQLPDLSLHFTETPAGISRLHDKSCAAHFLTPVPYRQKATLHERYRISGLE